jgi:hypothetical protein
VSAKEDIFDTYCICYDFETATIIYALFVDIIRSVFHCSGFDLSNKFHVFAFIYLNREIFNLRKNSQHVDYFCANFVTIEFIVTFVR